MFQDQYKYKGAAQRIKWIESNCWSAAYTESQQSASMERLSGKNQAVIGMPFTLSFFAASAVYTH